MISERERLIYDRIKNGETTRGIAKSLGISQTRVIQLFRRAKSKIDHSDWDDLKTLCYEFTCDEVKIFTRVYNVLRSNGIYTLEELDDISIDEISNMRGLGTKSISAIERMKKYIQKGD